MRFLSKVGRYRVPFEFEGRTLYLQVTKYTTFRDVVHLLTTHAGIPAQNARMYAAHEVTWDLERPISGCVRVVAIWRAWGRESNGFRFVVKSGDRTAIGASQDDGTSTGARREADRLVSCEMSRAHNSHGTSVCHEDETQRANGREVNNDDQSTERSNVSKTSESGSRSFFGNRSKGKEISGKLALFAKYFNDLKLMNKRKLKKRSKLGSRGVADGSHNPTPANGRYIVGRETSFSADNVSSGGSSRDHSTASMAACRYMWERYSDSDTDSELSDASLCDVDDGENFPEEEGRHSVDLVSACSRDRFDLDTAFMASSRDDADSDEGIDVTSVQSADLNTAFMAELDSRCVADGASLSDESSSLDEHNMNVFTADFVRRMFGAEDAVSVGSQDDQMDSFMRSTTDSFLES